MPLLRLRCLGRRWGRPDHAANFDRQVFTNVNKVGNHQFSPVSAISLTSSNDAPHQTQVGDGG
jgi:hypothetical protein